MAGPSARASLFQAAMGPGLVAPEETQGLGMQAGGARAELYWDTHWAGKGRTVPWSSMTHQ